MADSWVTIAQFPRAHEAEIIKGRLESEGIACVLLDTQTISIHPFYSPALGGVRLQVRPAQEEAARAILANP